MNNAPRLDDLTCTYPSQSTFHAGEYITPQYKVKGIFTQGGYGLVVACDDLQNSQEVAIKVMDGGTRPVAQCEIDMLREINKVAGNGCTKLLDEFDYEGQTCLVFSRYSTSVYDFMKRNRPYPWTPFKVQTVAEQLLHTIALLHYRNTAHTDLKPENIMFEQTSRNTATINGKEYEVLDNIKAGLIDFGSATVMNGDQQRLLVTTPPYRAPEVLCDMPSFVALDMWSVACILLELYTGRLLFDPRGDSAIDHLAKIESIVGPMPEEFKAQAMKVHPEYFGFFGEVWEKVRLPLLSKQLESVGLEGEEHNAFLQFLHGLLQWDPNERLTGTGSARSPLLFSRPLINPPQ